MQQRLRLHGVVRFDAALGEMTDDGIVLSLGFFQELHGGLAHRFVLVQFAVAKQQGRHGVDDQYVCCGIA